MRLGLSRRRKHVSAFGIILFAAFVFAGSALVLLVKMQPAFFDYAEKYANSITNSVVNSAVEKVYSSGKYSGLTGTNNGSIRTIETDAAKINIFRAELNQTIQDMLSERKEETVSVPMGSAMGWYFLAGAGPDIPIKIYPLSVVKTDLREEFDSAGINQVYHKIYVDVSIDISYVGLMLSETKTLTTTALLSETVIIGDTPQYYGLGEVAIE